MLSVPPPPPPSARESASSRWAGLGAVRSTCGTKGSSAASVSPFLASATHSGHGCLSRGL